MFFVFFPMLYIDKNEIERNVRSNKRAQRFKFDFSCWLTRGGASFRTQQKPFKIEMGNVSMRIHRIVYEI